MTGGVFTVTIWHDTAGQDSAQENILWDRKRDGGFPGMSSLFSFFVTESFLDIYIHILIRAWMWIMILDKIVDFAV
jgi:hypothetical protein